MLNFLAKVSWMLVDAELETWLYFIYEIVFRLDKEQMSDLNYNLSKTLSGVAARKECLK